MKNLLSSRRHLIIKKKRKLADTSHASTPFQDEQRDVLRELCRPTRRRRHERCHATLHREPLRDYL